ncbi:MAG: VCBS repeat-containing protein [Planctomycetota bacterium]|nr:VCBS repeat-containing protein [Planctomycetota bacterium]MDA1105011.1 VCBS repeat-containing protein [Planctomycetota bacterium]
MGRSLRHGWWESCADTGLALGVLACLTAAVAPAEPAPAGPPATDFEPFTNEAASRGVSYPTLSYPQTAGIYGIPAAWCDLDRDGDPDLVAGGHATGRLGLWENTAGTFADREPGSGLPELPGISSLSFADFDADGDPDLLCTMWGSPSRLFR